jgi:undecaprenyl diphosphate synthase
MKLYRQYLIGIRPLLDKNNVKLLHLGRREGLPDEVLKELDETKRLTAEHTGMKLGLALNYGGRNEILDVCKKLASDCKSGKMEVDDINGEEFSKRLYCPQINEVDLLIRTAGERRVSNFLLWQISYSEFYVTDVFWPDFKKADMEEAIKDYAYRQRRFGDISKGS